MYTRSLAPVDFTGAVFTYAHFQKIIHMYSLLNFHYVSEEIPSLMHFRLLMTYLSDADLVHAGFCQT